MPHEGWKGWLSGSPGVMLSAIVTGALTHVFLRRRSGAPFRCTLAAAVFASGPGALAHVAGWLASITIQTARGNVPVLSEQGMTTPWPVIVLGSLGSVWMILTTAAVHRRPWWAPLLALAASLATLTLGMAAMGVVAAVVAKKLGY
jgi:hypothetical protein